MTGTRRAALAILLALICCPARAWHPDRPLDPSWVPEGVSPIVRPMIRTRWNFNGLLPRMPDEADRGLAWLNARLPFIATRHHMTWIDSDRPVQQDNALRAAVGCVNLAVGQIMHHHRWPRGPARVGETFEALVLRQGARGFERMPATLSGGTGPGGAYAWDVMALMPQISDVYPLLDDEGRLPVDASGDVVLPPRSPLRAGRDETARLMADVGAAMGSVYVSDEDERRIMTAGVVSRVPSVFKDVFGYAGASCYAPLYGLAPIPAATFHALVGRSLERGLPVIVDLIGEAGDRGAGHAVIVDGYGRDAADPDTLLYHVLVGHGPVEPDIGGDGWYALPDERVAGQFRGVKGIVYDISPDEALPAREIPEDATWPPGVEPHIGGPGDDVHVGRGSWDVYVWEMGGGDDVIVNDPRGEREGPSGTLWIGEGHDLAAMEISREGDDIVVTLRGHGGARAGSVTVRGWYAAPGDALAMIDLAGGVALTTEDVEAWATP